MTHTVVSRGEGSVSSEFFVVRLVQYAQAHKDNVVVAVCDSSVEAWNLVHALDRVPTSFTRPDPVRLITEAESREALVVSPQGFAPYDELDEDDVLDLQAENWLLRRAFDAAVTAIHGPVFHGEHEAYHANWLKCRLAVERAYP